MSSSLVCHRPALCLVVTRCDRQRHSGHACDLAGQSARTRNPHQNHDGWAFLRDFYLHHADRADLVVQRWHVDFSALRGFLLLVRQDLFIAEGWFGLLLFPARLQLVDMLLNSCVALLILIFSIIFHNSCWPKNNCSDFFPGVRALLGWQLWSLSCCFQVATFRMWPHSRTCRPCCNWW